MQPPWTIRQPPESTVRKMVGRLHCHPVTARVLINRGITDPEHARVFWDATLSSMRPPFTMMGMDAAVDRIAAALARREPILVFGDYDVDGVTAATLVVDFLRKAGGDVSCYIPHRINEGYGLKAHHIHSVAAAGRVRLIITVDCGITSHEAATAAAGAGIDVIVTDHHEPSGALPEALAVVNPKRSDCASGFGMLAGVGVAFCLVAALRRHLRKIAFPWPGRSEPNLKAYLDLVALGTVADMVPLTAENRLFSRTGIDIVNTSPRPGLKALAQVAGINRTKPIDAEDIAFRLAPRLNAAGRMDHAMRAVELLSTTDPAAAFRISQELDRLNAERQLTERRILAHIEAHVTNHPRELQKNALIFGNEGWHLGVLGIVASRLVRLYGRPALLFSFSEGVARGSGRSVDGVDLFGALSRCRDLLTRFGGHQQAVGLELATADMDRFRERFQEAVFQVSGEPKGQPALVIDSELSFKEIDLKLLGELDRLQPYGTGNEEPLFMARDVRAVNTVIVGGAHRRVRLAQEGGRFQRTLNAIEFNFSSDLPGDGLLSRVAFRLRRNVWAGKEEVQLLVEGFSLPGPSF